VDRLDGRAAVQSLEEGEHKAALGRGSFELGTVEDGAFAHAGDRLTDDRAGIGVATAEERALRVRRPRSVGFQLRSIQPLLPSRIRSGRWPWIISIKPGLNEVDFRRRPAGDRAQPVPRPSAALAL
jgi:hypothetical protein